ncbi:2-oxoglutarate synthase [Desulfonema ishimotonii]|uniref:2-oxoglutarate synthase n=1 Tax=Desulfonema ishimotonii TaxID=45657 RepID=A0A401FWX2_9BACT|nr:thiamine pyrophosphate-dependent enzyme [Desulfonema ishimotonii]GBC61470.1 2-oxoglutarate synthase [Desulfonema ishimotonii]
MNSLLNSERPPVFCPGCSHDRVTQALDQALQSMNLSGNRVAIVSDIGCSGLFDTFFNTHALHGLHGRALTYATGLKMARPELHVIVTMGDGGLGIGGAHLLAACRRNLDLTLLVLNNFNYGMTGGQCSATTPPEAQVSSGFLNRLENPIDVCRIAGPAGAGYVTRVSTYQKDLPARLEKAMAFDGFSLVDIWGMCPGRYTRRNKLTPGAIEDALGALPPADGPADAGAGKEYGRHYREIAAGMKPVPPPAKIEAQFTPPRTERQEIVILGRAGQRIITAGELLGLAGITAGLRATQKNDYPVTVLRGHSVSELVLSGQPIGYTGIGQPDVIIALADEGVARRKKMLEGLTGNPLIIRASGVELPPCDAQITEADFRARKIRSSDWALAALALLAGHGRIITTEMLKAALGIRFKTAVRDTALELVDRVQAG